MRETSTRQHIRNIDRTSNLTLFLHSQSKTPSSKPAAAMAQNIGAVAPLLQFNADLLVTLLVGPEETKFTAHSSQLVVSSAFFTAALEKGWIEGQTRIIKLHDEDPEIFTHYLNFHYTHSLRRGLKQPLSSNTQQEMEKHVQHLCKLYVMAERLQDARVRNSIVDEILRLGEDTRSYGNTSWLSDGMVTVIYDGTAEGAPMRRFARDLAINTGDASWFADIGTPDPRWVKDIVGAFFRVSTGEVGRAYKLKAKDYYV